MGTSIWKLIERKREACINEKLDSGEPLGSKEREHIVNSLLSRVGFYYSGKNLLSYFMYCMCCRRSKTIREVSFYRQHWRLIQGEEKLHRDLDIRRLLKSARDVRVLRSTLFDKGERMLAKFQKHSIIETETSEGADDQIPIHTLMSQKKTDWTRFVTLNNVVECIKSSTSVESLNPITKRLIDGIFRTKPDVSD